MFRKAAFFTVLFLFLASALFAQAGTSYTLYYYGVVTNVNDQNMLNITQDLFAAQIRGINYVSLVDRRSDALKDSYSEIASDTDGAEFFRIAQSAYSSKEKEIVFYTRIYRAQSDAQWECTFFAKNTESGVVASRGKHYDSYYKILSDAKVFIQAVVAQAAGVEAAESSAAQNAPVPEAQKSLNTEIIAGDWIGEKGIEQIKLMRGGRCFIIFSTGAVMNANVTLFNEDGVQKLRIVQKDRFNASYYPGIERKKVLDFAETAAPIEWNFTMAPNGSLKGTKKTLVSKDGNVVPSSIEVVWTRR